VHVALQQDILLVGSSVTPTDLVLTAAVCHLQLHSKLMTGLLRSLPGLLSSSTCCLCCCQLLLQCSHLLFMLLQSLLRHALLALLLLLGQLFLANKLLLVVLGLSSQSTRCRHNQTAAAAAVPLSASAYCHVAHCGSSMRSDQQADDLTVSWTFHSAHGTLFKHC
jgi:hypothetical protein